jgi:16S rRNA (cytidine1402-2'-O)-methyltransferase
MESARGVLWIVATPIGTLDDLAPRAREVLAAVDLILAEDTRRIRSLLSHLGIRAGSRLHSLHEHNEAGMVAKVMAALGRGSSAALVSDAGTPVLSDPGFLIVRAARLEGVKVCSVPGSSAFTAALAASGLPPLPATLAGFLPRRQGPRRRRVNELAVVPWTVVVLLSPHRLAQELRDLAAGFGESRPAVLLAELSKVHERALCGTLDELASCPEGGHPRGEYVLVVGPSDDQPAAGHEPSLDEIRSAYQRAVAQGAERPAALRQVARSLGVSRRVVFAALVEDD